jgi:hypothetical protein
MRTLSASEAISPAIDRTKSVLFEPFQKGRSWKLAATAYLAVMGNVFLPTHLAFLGMPRQPGMAGTNFLLFFLLFGVIVTVVMALFFYAGVRLQFVRFDIVLTRSKMVAPLWRKYAFCTWRWLGLKLVLSIAFLIICGAPMVALFRFFMAHTPTPGQQPPPEFVSSFLLAYMGFVLGIGALMLFASLLNDFVLPPVALENATVSEGLRRFFGLFRKEPGQLISYILFKAVLGIAAAVAMEIGIILVELVAAIPLGLIAFVGWFLLHSHGQIGQILIVAGSVVLALIFFVFIFYTTIGLFGCPVLFFQAYALYFLGGRYPLLGDLLEPGPSGSTFASPPGQLPPMPDPTI